MLLFGDAGVVEDESSKHLRLMGLDAPRGRRDVGPQLRSCWQGGPCSTAGADSPRSDPQLAPQAQAAKHHKQAPAPFLQRANSDRRQVLPSVKPSHSALDNSAFCSIEASRHRPTCLFPGSRIAICHQRLRPPRPQLWHKPTR